MFSEITRMRPAWARSPDAAMAIDFTKSMDYLRAVVVGAAAASGLAADRGFDQPEAAGVELVRGLVVHLVGGNLDHLVLEVDRVAGRTDLILVGIAAERRVAAEARDVARIGARQLQRLQPGRRHAKVRRDQILRAVVRGVGVGD